MSPFRNLAIFCFSGLVSIIATCEQPVPVGQFVQQTHTSYSSWDNDSAGRIERIAIAPGGEIYVGLENAAVYYFDGSQFKPTPDNSSTSPFPEDLVRLVASEHGMPGDYTTRDVAQLGTEIAVATDAGLYIKNNAAWELAMPAEGNLRWAPVDVRGVTYDEQGQLWFASPQGVGCRVGENEWRLYTAADGLPFNDFTCIASGSSGVWFGTTNGAIQFHEGQWHFRQGGRWLVDNHVNDIVVDNDGDAWIATNKGVSRIQHQTITLVEKATLFEEEIEKYHRRTTYGYVNPATLSTPGDKSTASPRFSDNDGFNTGLYLGAMSFAYSTTSEDRHREHAHNAFRALAFLSEVTQGGRYGGPKGLIARNVVPTTEPDPGAVYDEDYDIRRNERDKLWKIMERRVPVDKTGEWYWKADASSDELDGHFFGTAIYYDLVCETENEKNAAREVVRRIIDHLIEHDYSLVDYDGQPTRWGQFSPDSLNRDPAWSAERGLNSYSILTYLSIAHHILGDQKYRDAYLKLAFDHGYGMNGMTQPKELPGPDSAGHQPDDNMAFMNYYHLIRYETDPTLLSMYQSAIREHWKYEKFERNAFTNFIYGAVAKDKTRTDQWRTIDLSPPVDCYLDAIDTLKRFPLDLIEWPMSNAHRIDMQPLIDSGTGSDTHGYAFPIDERAENYWDWNYWQLTGKGDGTTLRPPHHFLLAYYMGQFHGFIAHPARPIRRVQ